MQQTLRFDNNWGSPQMKQSYIELYHFNYPKAVKYGYKPSLKHRLISRAIMLRSNPHTHTELRFSERYYNRRSFSSTMQDKDNGCRFKDIQYSHPERWDIQRIPVSTFEEDKIFTQAYNMVLRNKGYDLFGLLSFATPLKIIRGNKKKHWCSEACIKAVCEGSERIRKDLIIFDNKDPHRYEINPNKLFRLIKEYI